MPRRRWQQLWARLTRPIATEVYLPLLVLCLLLVVLAEMWLRRPLGH